MRTVCLICLAAAVAMAASLTLAQEPQNKHSVPQGPSLKRQAQVSTIPPHYIRPNFPQRFDNYLSRTYGPMKLAELAMGSAISHADNVPPEWQQGWGAYGKRFASDTGSTAASGTAEFALAEALRVDTKYYRCTCEGIWARVGHALKSTVSARSGKDGHRVFSFPGVAAPYAGAFSTLAWYPSRYGPEDALRTGNYDLLERFGENLALEFLDPALHKFHLR